MKIGSTAPLPVLGLEADQEREARRQRRMLAAGRASLVIGTISLSLMAVGLLGFVPTLLFTAVQRFNDSHGNYLFGGSLVIIFFLSLPGGIISYVVSTFAGKTPAGRRGAFRGILTIGLLVIAAMAVGCFGVMQGDKP